MPGNISNLVLRMIERNATVTVGQIVEAIELSGVWDEVNELMSTDREELHQRETRNETIGKNPNGGIIDLQSADTEGSKSRKDMSKIERRQERGNDRWVMIIELNVFFNELISNQMRHTFTG